MVFCAAYGCSSKTFARLGFSNIKESNRRRFFSFPKEEHRQKRWLAVLKRDDLTVTRYTRICDLHFLPSDLTPDKRQLKSTATPLGPHVTQQEIARKIVKDERYEKRCQKRENILLDLRQPSVGPSNDPSSSGASASYQEDHDDYTKTLSNAVEQDVHVEFNLPLISSSETSFCYQEERDEELETPLNSTLHDSEIQNPFNDLLNQSLTSSSETATSYQEKHLDQSNTLLDSTVVVSTIEENTLGTRASNNCAIQVQTCCTVKHTQDIGIQVDIDSFLQEIATFDAKCIENEHSYVVPGRVLTDSISTEDLANCDLPTSSPVSTLSPVLQPLPSSPVTPCSLFPMDIHDLSDNEQESFCSEEINRKEESDNSFDPTFCSSEESLDISLETADMSQAQNAKYIVFDSCLDELFTICKYCRSPLAEVNKTREGSSLKVSVICMNHCSYKWSSQPQSSGMAVGNLLIAAAILFSGLTFQRFQQWATLLKLVTISESTFYSIQGTYLWPVIKEAWMVKQAELFESVKRVPVKLAGDGRCDSPGHSAKYGTYTLLDTATDKILAFEVVQKTEVNNSACMEKEGLVRCLEKLEKNDIAVQQLATDRHPQIVCHMKKTQIDHQFDIWHVSKSVIKKLTQRSKGKKCEELRPWIRCVANHLWWSAATCKGEYNLLKDKWISVVHHVVNIHEWGHSEVFTKCEHEPLPADEVRSTDWLKRDSPAHKALTEVVTEKKLLQDLKLMTDFAHTGSLEVYHSMLTKYCPKRNHFPYQGMQARTMLAVLDHNQNTGRGQATTESGEERYKFEWSKISKNWVAKPINVDKDYSYLEDLMRRVVEIRGENIKLPGIEKPQQFPQNIAPEPMPEKIAILEKHMGRFQIE